MNASSPENQVIGQGHRAIASLQSRHEDAKAALPIKGAMQQASRAAAPHQLATAGSSTAQVHATECDAMCYCIADASCNTSLSSLKWCNVAGPRCLGQQTVQYAIVRIFMPLTTRVDLNSAYRRQWQGICSSTSAVHRHLFALSEQGTRNPMKI